MAAAFWYIDRHKRKQRPVTRLLDEVPAAFQCDRTKGDTHNFGGGLAMFTRRAIHLISLSVIGVGGLLSPRQTVAKQQQDNRQCVAQCPSSNNMGREVCAILYGGEQWDWNYYCGDNPYICGAPLMTLYCGGGPA